MADVVVEVTSAGVEPLIGEAILREYLDGGALAHNRVGGLCHV